MTELNSVNSREEFIELIKESMITECKTADLYDLDINFDLVIDFKFNWDNPLDFTHIQFWGCFFNGEVNICSESILGFNECFFEKKVTLDVYHKINMVSCSFFSGIRNSYTNYDEIYWDDDFNYLGAHHKYVNANKEYVDSKNIFEGMNFGMRGDLLVSNCTILNGLKISKRYQRNDDYTGKIQILTSRMDFMSIYGLTCEKELSIHDVTRRIETCSNDKLFSPEIEFKQQINNWTTRCYL